MKGKKYTQAQQVIDTLREQGGYATLGNLYHLVDTSTWATKTPNESIRRIVQQSQEIFKIQPGLWALEECRDKVMRKFELKPGNKKSEEQFTHGYYQGLLTAMFRRSVLLRLEQGITQRNFLMTPTLRFVSKLSNKILITAI